MRVILCHNPSAGDDQPAPDELIAELTRAGYRAVYHSLKAGHLDAVLDGGWDLAVAAGGDGSVRRVARAVMGRQMLLAVLPLGTANNIASALGISGSPAQVIGAWRDALPVPFDVGVVCASGCERFFLEGAGFGVFPRAAACRTRQRRRANGGAVASEDELHRDLRALKERVERDPARHWRVRLDDEEIDGRFLLLEAMNIASIGPRAALAPDADAQDGLLDVVLVGEGERSRLAAYLADCLAGRDDGRPDLPVRRVRRVEVHGAGARMHADDRIWLEGDAAGGLAVDLRIRPGALRILAPAAARPRSSPRCPAATPSD